MLKSKTIKDMLTGVNNQFSNVKINAAEEILMEIFAKVENGVALEEQEVKFFNIYLSKYYPEKVGGSLYPYPNYDDKLKPIYHKIAHYFIKNIGKNTYESTIFLQYYYLTEMAKDYKITPNIRIGDKKYFEKKPSVRAYHTSEKTIIGTIPIVCYNPDYIREVVNNNQVLNIINTGFHELEHEVQEIEMKKEKIDNAQALLWAKEHVARKVIGNMFYNINYFQHFYERDARHYAFKRIEKILSEINCLEHLSTLSEDKKQNDKYDTTIIFKDVENKNEEILAIDLLDSITTSFIKKYYSQLLQQYPVLNTIYDEKGNKKILSQIETEIEERRIEEINVKPDDKEIIEKKYDKLLYDICQTDNDLKIQYLCSSAAYLESVGDEIALKIMLKRIDKLMKNRNISYESFIKRIEEKLASLDVAIRKNTDYNSSERQKLVATKKATLELKKCLLKYNSDFREKHNKETIKNQIKQKLEQKMSTKIDRFHWILGTNGVVTLKDKTRDELYEQYKEHIAFLASKTSSKEELDEYLKYLSETYDDMYQELDKKDEVPGR